MSGSLFKSSRIVALVFCASFLNMSIALQKNCSPETKAIAQDFAVGALGGVGAMAVYTPFHYFQNRTLQKLPIVWERPAVWFRGLPSLALGKAPTLAVQMATYGIIARGFQKNNPEIEMSPQQKLFAAMIAGAASGTINNFTHAVALLQENQGNSFGSAVKQLRTSGSLTRGLGTTMAREIVFTYFYQILLKRTQTHVATQVTNTKLAAGISSLLCGMGVAATTQPFMVITAQLYADLKKQQYANAVDVIRKIGKEEGLLGFYQGTGYRFVGITLAFPVFNYIKELFGGQHGHS